VGVTVGSPDDVGAMHQALDGRMLDLNVAADFLCGMTVAGVIVDYEAAEGDMIVATCRSAATPRATSCCAAATPWASSSWAAPSL
jgi:hypothetical protein